MKLRILFSIMTLGAILSMTGIGAQDVPPIDSTPQGETISPSPTPGESTPIATSEETPAPTPKPKPRRKTPTPSPSPTAEVDLVNAPATEGGATDEATSPTGANPREQFLASPTAVTVTTATAPAASPAPSPEAEDANKAFQFSVKASLEPNSDNFPAHSEFTYRLTAEWVGKPDDLSVQFPEKIDSSANLNLAETPAPNVSTTPEGKQIRIQDYVFRTLSEGDATIGPVSVGATADGNKHLTEQKMAKENLRITPRQKTWLQPILLGVGGLVLLLVIIWLISISNIVTSRQRYHEAMRDDTPSIDERLQSEIITLKVSLLRGSIGAYYEKIGAILRQILKNRGLIGNLEASDDEIAARLQSGDIDPAFREATESIMQRCHAVLMMKEKPDEAAHNRIAKDLKVLVGMRPTGGGAKARAKE